MTLTLESGTGTILPLKNVFKLSNSLSLTDMIPPTAYPLIISNSIDIAQPYCLIHT
jgi:hypothetical protein